MKPLVTEKTTQQAELNQYAFLVPTHLTKSQLKTRLEALYGVKLIKLHTQRRRPLSRRTGRKRLPTPVPALKKVTITVKAGQSLTVTQFKAVS
ncbi:50S ribosomal protein L23 [Microgenomates group bacterium RBG_16_45_19]|nr:MAG: 50S ribosomal protein L23 [Microgenomates group bacterium RBG_16_45_19]